jgi:hypothetical protein
MSQDIEALESTTFNEKRFARKQIVQIQETIKLFPDLSRRELSHTICEHFQWVTPKGVHRVQFCLAALEEMEKAGIIKLPAKRKYKKGSQKETIWTGRTKEQPRLCCSLDNLMPISVQEVKGKEDIVLWNEFVDRHHYLGYRRPMGDYLRYFIVSKKKDEMILGCMLFSAAVRSLPCRDQWIGWSDKDRRRRLNFILNNNRFLIFPWIDVKNLVA